MVTGSLRLSDISVIWHVAKHRTTQKIWGGIMYKVYRPGEWLWNDSTVDMETKNHIGGYFGSEFPFRRSVIIAEELWWPEVTRGIFLEKWPLTVKFSKFCSESFHRDINQCLCSNIVKCGWQQIVLCLPDKKTKFRRCRYWADHE